MFKKLNENPIFEATLKLLVGIASIVLIIWGMSGLAQWYADWVLWRINTQKFVDEVTILIKNSQR